MNTAEKYRQQFAANTGIFTLGLPYAIVFGCVTKWAKAFEAIDTSQFGYWYSGSTPFQPVSLSRSLESLNSSVSSAIATPSGGGRSSGFGGGGGAGSGGGGSW